MPTLNEVDRSCGDLGWRTLFRPLVAASLLALLAVAACGDQDPTLEPPTISSLTADPEQIQPGDSSTLAWSVSGATSLTLFPGAVDVTGSTSLPVSPTVSTSYRLVAANAAGENEASKTIIVGDLPTIQWFAPVAEEGRELVNPGVTTTITWSVVDADSVTFEGPGVSERSVALVGSMEVVPPTVGATYTLTATNSAGPIEDSVVVSRAVPAFSVLIAGQSNAKGVNISPDEALAFIAAAPGVEMLGNDYEWKDAYEPTGDCTGHVDLVSIDPDRTTPCTEFSQNVLSNGYGNGVSPGVSLANSIAVASGGEVFLVPAAKNGSALDGRFRDDDRTPDPSNNWQPDIGTDRYDRETLFGSAAYRAQLAGIQRAAPLSTTYEGADYGAVLWYQGTSDTGSTSQTNAYFHLTNNVLSAFEEELGAPIILVQLSSRTNTDERDRNLLYQRVREVQRRMAEGAHTLAGDFATEARAGRYLVVTHDLPMSDPRHLSADGQLELGRRVSLAVREHLLNQKDVDGTGPRLLRVVKMSSRVVHVVLDRPVSTSSNIDDTAYSGYFTAFSGGNEVAIHSIVRDPSATSIIRITLESAVSDDAAVEIRYMPPEGHPTTFRHDVVRSLSCADPFPCLPLPAFGMATSSVTASALRMTFFDDDED